MYFMIGAIIFMIGYVVFSVYLITNVYKDDKY